MPTHPTLAGIGPRLDHLATEARALSRTLTTLINKETDLTLHGHLHRAHRVVSEFSDNLNLIRSCASESVRRAIGWR